MRYNIYSEGTKNLLFTVFDSAKQQKTNVFRTHHHPELEIGLISSGRGDYIIEGTMHNASDGDIFLVRPNEQHCIPTIYTPELASFNFHITSYYIWNVVSEYVEPSKLRFLVGGTQHGQPPFPRKIGDPDNIVRKIVSLCGSDEDAHRNRFEIRFLTLRLIVRAAELIEDAPSADTEPELDSVLAHQGDIQNAISFINDNLTEPITLDDISRSAGLSRSHLSVIFRTITGISPYEYLLLQRIERSVALLRSGDKTILEVAQSCGFRNLANFNKSFKKVTGMTPSAYRASKRANTQNK